MGNRQFARGQSGALDTASRCGINEPRFIPPSRGGCMFDLSLTDEQNAIVDTARDFAKREIAPVAGKLDEEGHFPHEICRKAFELGLMNLEVPEPYGGLGLSCLTHCLVLEEIAWGC